MKDTRRAEMENFISQRQRVSMQELCDTFAVSMNTIRTDVDVLSLTYPIQTTRGRYNDGIGFIDGYRPKNARLTPIQRDFLYRIMCKVSNSDQEIVQSILHDFALTQ